MSASRITSFFRPTTQPSAKPVKRSLPDDSSSENSRKRSKSPKVSGELSSPLPIRTDSPNAKRTSLLPSSDLNAQSSDSDIEDTIVVKVPSWVVADAKVPPPSSAEIKTNLSFASSASNASHRREHHGQTVITGSDDSDSDSLLDLDDLLGKRPTRAKASDETPRTRRALRKSTSRSQVKKYVDTSKVDAAVFSNLIKTAQSEIQSNQDSKEAIRLADNLDSGRPINDVELKEVRGNLTIESIVSRLGDTNPEEAERFTQAIERTELTQTVYKWSFFENLLRDSGKTTSSENSCRSAVFNGQNFEGEYGTHLGSSDAIDTSSYKSSPGPRSITSKTKVDNIHATARGKVRSEPHHSTTKDLARHGCGSHRLNSTWPEFKHQPGWAIYQDSDQRDIALKGGTFEQAAVDGHLPDELYIWILEQSFCESDQHLLQAYRKILNTNNKSITSNRALRTCRFALEELGASKEAIESSNPILKTPVESSDVDPLSGVQDALQTWLHNIECVVLYMDTQDCSKLFDYLLTLTLDSGIAANAPLLLGLQIALNACLEHFKDNETDSIAILGSLRRLFDKAGDAQFRLQCVTTLPILSPKSTQLRRRLALATFYEDASHLEHDSAATLLHGVRLHLISQKQFQMTGKTDYRKILALFSCLDIAIGDGNPPQTSDSIMIKKFNDTLDELANMVQSKYARIQAHGAAHISRTQTKDVLEAIERRLRYSVRTRTKPKADPFMQRTLDSVVRKYTPAPIDDTSRERASVIA